MFVCCLLIIFFKINIFEKIVQEHYQKVLNGLNSGQDQCYAGPDLDPNCLLWLSTDDKFHGKQGRSYMSFL